LAPDSVISINSTKTGELKWRKEAIGKGKKRKKSVNQAGETSRVRAEVNRANRTRVRTIMKRFATAMPRKTERRCNSCFQSTLSAIDRAIKQACRGKYGQPLQVAIDDRN